MLKAITVCTKSCPQLDNWRRSGEYNNIECIVIGMGEKWGGWIWRTQKYLEYIDTLDPNEIILLTDATDVIFIDNADQILSKFINNGSKVIIGAEPACCTGIYSSGSLRYKAEQTLKERIPNNRYRFPNGGLMIGYVKDISKLLRENSDDTDDQAGYLDKFLNNTSLFTLDHNANIFGNIPNMNPYVRVSDDPSYDEMVYWENINDNGCIKLRNKIHQTSPCVLHFPGKNWDHYNKVGSLFFDTTVFEPIPIESQINDTYIILLIVVLFMIVCVLLFLI